MEKLNHSPDTGSGSAFRRPLAHGQSGGMAGLLMMACALLVLAACGVTPRVPGHMAAEPARQLVFPAAPDEPRFYYERSLYGSSDIELGQGGDTSLRQLLTGEKAKVSLEGMAKPYAVAVHQGRVYVTDTVDRYVTVFDFSDQSFYRIGDSDPGQLMKPMGLDVDRDGNLYVADTTMKRVVVFDKDGNFLRKIGDEKSFSRLNSVTLDPRGDRLYVVDIGGVKSNEHRVRVFDPVSGKHLFDFGKRGSGPGEFNFPYDLAVGKDGRLYVVDAGNFRVQVFDHDGKYLSSFGTIGTQLGNFARPKEIAADADGNLYVIDAILGYFQIFDPDGNVLLIVGKRANEDGPAQYMLPSGIAIDEDGRVYVVDQWFKKIDVFRPARLKPNEGFLVGKPASTPVSAPAPAAPLPTPAPAK